MAQTKLDPFHFPEPTVLKLIFRINRLPTLDSVGRELNHRRMTESYGNFAIFHDIEHQLDASESHFFPKIDVSAIVNVKNGLEVRLPRLHSCFEFVGDDRLEELVIADRSNLLSFYWGSIVPNQEFLSSLVGADQRPEEPPIECDASVEKRAALILRQLNPLGRDIVVRVFQRMSQVIQFLHVAS